MMHHTKCGRLTKACQHYKDQPDATKSCLRPACCTANFKILVNYTTDVLNELDIPFWLDYGTLLGSYRNEEFIPWDGDVDVSLFDNSVSRLLKSVDRIVNDGFCLAFRYEDLPIGSKYWNYSWQPESYQKMKRGESKNIESIRVLLSKENRSQVDIHVCVKEHQEVRQLCKRLYLINGSPYMNLKFFSSFGQTKLYNKVFPCPNHVEEYLALVYGEDFRTPKRVKPNWNIKY